MKIHVRILYAVAVAALLVAGFALKADNDVIATKIASSSSTTTATVTSTGSTP